MEKWFKLRDLSTMSRRNGYDKDVDVKQMRTELFHVMGSAFVAWAMCGCAFCVIKVATTKAPKIDFTLSSVWIMVLYAIMWAIGTMYIALLIYKKDKAPQFFLADLPERTSPSYRWLRVVMYFNFPAYWFSRMRMRLWEEGYEHNASYQPREQSLIGMEDLSDGALDDLRGYCQAMAERRQAEAIHLAECSINDLKAQIADLEEKLELQRKNLEEETKALQKLQDAPPATYDEGMLMAIWDSVRSMPSVKDVFLRDDGKLYVDLAIRRSYMGYVYLIYDLRVCFYGNEFACMVRSQHGDRLWFRHHTIDDQIILLFDGKLCDRVVECLRHDDLRSAIELLIEGASELSEYQVDRIPFNCVPVGIASTAH